MRTRLVLALPPLLLAAVALPATAPAKAPARPAIERLPQVTAGNRTLPFSEGVRVGDVLYLSGQIGVAADGTIPPGFEPQARLALDHVTASLKKAGLGWKDVTRCLVMLKDMADWPAFNSIYAAYVDPANLPARSAIGASGLALGALVEVQCDAYSPVK